MEESDDFDFLCDRDRLKNDNSTWYRFNSGPASQMIPTDPVKMIHCGTLSPGWLTRIHPKGNNSFISPLTVAIIDFLS